MQLGEYDAKIVYIPGNKNKIADFLSRIDCTKREINAIDPENLGITLNEMFDIKSVNVGENQQQSETSLAVHTDHCEHELENVLETLDT